MTVGPVLAQSPRFMITPSSRTPIGVVVPSFNSRATIAECLDSVIAAAERWGPVRITVVDNGSTDGSDRLIEQRYANRVDLLRCPSVRVGAVRNHGARRVQGEVLSFIDADCVVGADYFASAVASLERSAADATGSPYALPSSPGWIETTWHSLHDRRQTGQASYLNAGNFVIRRTAFDSVGGFDEALETGEDAELGERLRAAGHRIHPDPEVAAVHLGNPQSLRAFWIQQRWHGIGAFGTARHNLLDKPLLMTLLHLGVTLAGAGWSTLAGRRWSASIAILGASQILVPAAAVCYRSVQTRRSSGVLRPLLLYWLYFWARIAALAGMGRRSRGRR